MASSPAGFPVLICFPLSAWKTKAAGNLLHLEIRHSPLTISMNVPSLTLRAASPVRVAHIFGASWA